VLVKNKLVYLLQRNYSMAIDRCNWTLLRFLLWQC